MKQTIAITLASALFLNTVQAAYATEFIQAQKAIAGNVNEKQILEIMKKADSKTTEELTQALTQVRGLITKLNDIQSTNESDPWLKYANQAQIIIATMSVVATNSHAKASEVSKVLLALNTASLAINKYISVYKDKHQLDATTLSKIVFDTSRDLSKQGNLTPEMEKITSSLNTVSSTLLESQDLMGKIAEKAGVGQDAALAMSGLYLILHLVSPKIAQESDVVLKGILPKLQSGAMKSAEVAKKPVTVGNFAAGGSDIFSAVVGMNSEDSQKLILSTLVNLESTANKIQSELNSRATK